jgi:hypothetical protein
MIGIYSDSFLDDLKSLFGDENIKIKSHNLIVPCPWCEVGQKKEHYHLYISLEIPIFNCFHAGCKEGHGFIGKFVKKLLGFDGTDRYVDKNNIKEYKCGFWHINDPKDYQLIKFYENKINTETEKALNKLTIKL